MKSFLFALALGMCVAAPMIVRSATTPVAPTARRQVLECMSRQMAASRTLSYIDASRACKSLIKAHNDTFVSANEARPVIAR